MFAWPFVMLACMMHSTHKEMYSNFTRQFTAEAMQGQPCSNHPLPRVRCNIMVLTMDMLLCHLRRMGAALGTGAAPHRRHVEAVWEGVQEPAAAGNGQRDIASWCGNPGRAHNSGSGRDGRLAAWCRANLSHAAAAKGEAHG